MGVKVNFEIDLEGLVEANKDHILLKGRSNEDIINELKDLFEGDLSKGISNYCKYWFVLEFGNIFNY